MPFVDELIRSIQKILGVQQTHKKKRKSSKKKKKSNPQKVVRKKKAVKKPAVKRKTTRKTVKPSKKKTSKQLTKKTVKKKPSSLSNRPKASKKKNIKTSSRSSEVQIGEITHFFSKIQVCVVKVKSGSLKLGERLHIKGTHTDFMQKVGSLQVESKDVSVARKGQLVGLRVSKKTRVGDHVYKLR